MNVRDKFSTRDTTRLPDDTLPPFATAELPKPIVEEAVGDMLNPDDVDDFATVTVMPYEGMTSGDIVWIFFGQGSGGGEEIDYVLISDNLVGRSVRMDVPKEKVSFFDTATVTVYYAVHRDGVLWARSEDLVLNVMTPMRWPAPYVEEAVGDDLPEDAFARGVRTVVPRHEDMQAGDVIKLFWEGGGNQYTDSIPISSPIDFRFRVQKETVDLWIGQTVQIFYTITRGATVIHSEVLNLRVAITETLLPAPVMDQVVDGKLNLADVTDFVDFRILPYEGMRAGDIVFVDLGPGEGNGGATVTIQVSQNGVGLPLEDAFARHEVERFVGQTVAVKYRVEGVTGHRESEALMVEVIEAAATLNPPNIPAVSNGELDPRQVLGGAQVVVPFASLMQQGDRVVLTWDCTKDAGDYTDTNFVGGGNGDIPFTVPYDMIAKGIDGTVTVTYELLRGTTVIGTGSAMAFVIRRPELPAVVLVEADGGSLDPDDVPAQGASVEIASTALFALDDVVTLIWRGTTEYSTSHTITAADVGSSLVMKVPKAQVVENIGTVVTVYYTIRRTLTGDTEESPLSVYEVYRESGSGGLVVLGARNGDADYRVSGAGRYLRAVSATTRNDIVAEWRYEGDMTSESGVSFLDKEPWRLLHVRAGEVSISVLPLHLVGSGLNFSTSDGAASFAALLSTGRPYAWAHFGYGGNIPMDVMGIDVQEIHSTHYAFAARRSDGEVHMWGDPYHGGAVGYRPTNVMRLAGSQGAFACVKHDGMLLAWGRDNMGATLTQEAIDVRDAQSIVAAGWAFCAVRKTGDLVTWGREEYGGAIPAMLKAGPYVSVRGNGYAFSALRANGTVVAWGYDLLSGKLSEEVEAADNIVEIAASTQAAFAVLTSERKVMAWGGQGLWWGGAGLHQAT
ncbi:hypothetical protein PAN31117_04251 [Pandoraea anapnoica]|uniref:Uncharacterized protein n=2 Tax=Pandoraea anapnoica TaxID=2508301 RepID=A0A5E5AGN8_9BURK|nr:hypothetical protein PAN31117_04251 [Pandoraea anapnoica]